MLASAAAARAADEGGYLWQIGRADNNFGEFAGAPSGFKDFATDGLFVVGRSDPRRDWPYVQPGPADTWAGGRAHTFRIYFGLSADAAWGRLVVDLADTHGIRPPVLRIAVNGRAFEHATPRGGTDASIMGNASAGKEHRFSISIPAGVLKKGLNEIDITTAGGSWMLYDWLGLKAAGARLVPAAGATLKSVSLRPWLVRRAGRLCQPVEVELACVGAAPGLVLRATGSEPVKIPAGAPSRTVELYLPPAEAVREVVVELMQAGQTLASRRIEQGPARQRLPVDYVDCMIGTSSSRWMLFPGPAMPFGMVKLSPDNQRRCWKAGYEYTITNIAGFSHLHSWTMGGLLTMPTVGKLQVVPGGEKTPDAGYRSRFRHETEIARPGYYAVTLDDYGIRAELTCTTRAGFQRYTFPKASQARILFDLEFPTEYGFKVLDARITKVSDTEIAGYSKQRSRPWNEYTVYFVARVNRPFRSMGGWVNDAIKRDVKEIAGKGDVGCFLSYSTDKGDVVELKTGISLVSIDQARLNLDTETGRFGWDFDACRRHARKTWNDLLSSIEVEGGTELQKVKFYTNMYRAYCARTIWSDVNGKYVDMYEKVRQLKDPNSPVYGCDAFWNTFWNLNQLWILSQPDIAAKWVRSLLEIYDRGGWLPKGPTGIEYSSIMVASHEIALIVAAWQAGIHDFDVQNAYQAIRKMQTTPGRPHPGGGHVGNRQLASYMKLGYVPMEKGPVSNTLEYAYDDWCAAQLAKALGKTDDYTYFLERSMNYRNVFDPSVGFIRQKHADGRWAEKFSTFSRQGFVEGNSWQYTWFAPHDVSGLVRLLGRETFNDRLERGLIQSRKTRFTFPVNHGNQPNMQSCWLFNYSGKPWLAQKWAREILAGYYGAGPIDGWPGDEDQGQMGAWYVMTAMGLFQMNGGCSVRPIYEIASPIFDKVVIHLDPKYYSGGKFIIETRNNSPQNVYIQS
ncbi:MAG: GH92 family glycosyl hydrolase, partial [Planctomycetes bacterium]|nr:GH92 family glycosyl hydrolase [Planctomycetota bacterium]